MISILHIRQDFPLQNRLPVWRQARQLTPVVFNSQLLPFVLSFCCSKANPAQQQSGSGRWLPCPMDSCPHLKSRHHNCLQKFLMCFACGVWTQVKEVLQEDVCTVRDVKPATDSLQQNQKCQWLAPKGVMSRPPRERKWWLHQGQVTFTTRSTPTKEEDFWYVFIQFPALLCRQGNPPLPQTRWQNWVCSCFQLQEQQKALGAYSWIHPLVIKFVPRLSLAGWDGRKANVNSATSTQGKTPVALSEVQESSKIQAWHWKRFNLLLEHL